LRSGTSVAANYRAAGRARSKAEFVAKIGVVLEEADETVFWLELLQECAVVKPERLQELLAEANELTAIFAAAHQNGTQSFTSLGIKRGPPPFTSPDHPMARSPDSVMKR